MDFEVKITAIGEIRNAAGEVIERVPYEEIVRVSDTDLPPNLYTPAVTPQNPEIHPTH